MTHSFLHDALPISCRAAGASCWVASSRWPWWAARARWAPCCTPCSPALPSAGSSKASSPARRSEEHTSELQSLMRLSYAVFCLKKQDSQLHGVQLESVVIKKLALSYTPTQI